MVDNCLPYMTIFTILKGYSEFSSNFILEKGTEGICGEVVSVLCGRGEDFCLCNRWFCYSIDLGDLFWGHIFGVVCWFSLRHEFVACIDLEVGPSSVWVRHSPVPHTPHFDLPLFCIQSLRCDPSVSWTQGARTRSERRGPVNKVWQDRVILII